MGSLTRTMLMVAKNTTGLTGLPVAKMPGDYAYRKNTEQLIMDRAAVVKSTQDVLEMEKKIGCGQIEEVIVQAENELVLARTILECKAWEPLVAEAPPRQWKWPV